MATSTSHAQRGRIGGLRRAALAPDTQALTAAARRARFQKYVDQIREALPDLVDQAEIIRRAEQLRRADMASMSLKAATARRLKRELAALDAELDASGLLDAGSDGIDADS
jgi:hypothetical protein